VGRVRARLYEGEGVGGRHLTLNPLRIVRRPPVALLHRRAVGKGAREVVVEGEARAGNAVVGLGPARVAGQAVLVYDVLAVGGDEGVLPVERRVLVGLAGVGEGVEDPQIGLSGVGVDAGDEGGGVVVVALVVVLALDAQDGVEGAGALFLEGLGDLGPRGVDARRVEQIQVGAPLGESRGDGVLRPEAVALRVEEHRVEEAAPLLLVHAQAERPGA
jgi:hypothetical protein